MDPNVGTTVTNRQDNASSNVDALLSLTATVTATQTNSHALQRPPQRQKHAPQREPPSWRQPPLSQSVDVDIISLTQFFNQSNASVTHDSMIPRFLLGSSGKSIGAQDLTELYIYF